MRVRHEQRPVSARFTYVITFLLGLAFSFSLIQSAWESAVERKQQDFHFEILSIQQAISSNVLAGNDITNHVAAFIASNETVLANQFAFFSGNILERYAHIEAINYYPFTGDEQLNTFHFLYGAVRDGEQIKNNDDIYADPKYIKAIDTAIATRSIVPAPPDPDNNPDRQYWLFKAIYSEDKHSSITEKKQYDGVIKGIVSVLVSPVKLLGEKGLIRNLTVTIFNDTSLYGRKLLYLHKSKSAKKILKIQTLSAEKRIQLPPYTIKVFFEKALYFLDLEYYLLLVSSLISAGVMLMLYGLVRARLMQEEELKTRNAVIEQKVTEQTHELAIARDEALEAVRIKSEFLASMSHEIRTPLNAIIGMSDLMSETSLTTEQERYVSSFKKAGDTLLSLVNDILDLSKIEAGQLQLEKVPFDIVELIEESVDIYSLKAADKDIEIIARADMQINSHRIGDPGRLKQIMLNLISNALKFTDKGEIVVTLSIDDKENSDQQLVISVSDTGIGIAQDKLKSIFASFTQADTSTTRKYGGTGLGLTISKHLTEMMDGYILVESEAHKGSCFYVHISLPAQTKSSKITPVLADKKIIIIDPHISNCLSIEEKLLALGALCFKATSLSEAKQLFERKLDADFVLFDSRLLFPNNKPSLGLTEFMQSGQLILLITPKDISQHSKLAKANGIDKIMIKPIRFKDLYHDLSLIINPEHDKQLLEKEQLAWTDEPITAKQILLVEDNPDNRLLIKAYLKKTPYSIEEAENGVVAVERYKKNHYDLVLMDVQMPIMDGHEATRQIRALEAEQNREATIIISLTAHATREEIEKSMLAGCNNHLSKPIKKTILLQTMNELIQSKPA